MYDMTRILPSVVFETSDSDPEATILTGLRYRIVSRYFRYGNCLGRYHLREIEMVAGRGAGTKRGRGPKDLIFRGSVDHTVGHIARCCENGMYM
jgi:hypothetical protein